MLRNLLLLALAVLVARAVWLVVGPVQGRARQSRPGQPSRKGQGGHAPPRGVQMVRDPVCGTFVVPGRALAISEGSRQVFFCSANCRDKYRAWPSASSGRPGPVEGRTA